MSGSEFPVLDKIEGAFTGLGLGQSPLMRGVAGFAAFTLAEEALFKGGDNVFFKGSMRRPWSALSNDPEATPFPWWSPGVAGFMLFGMFI